MRYLLLSLFVALGACEGFVLYAPTPQGYVARGRELFMARGLGAVPYACVDCHPTEPEDPQAPALKPAHTLYDAAARGSWYDGRFKTRAVQGAQACLSERMQARPLEGDDLEAMQSYLQSLSPSRRAPPLSALPVREAPPASFSAEELAQAAAELGLEGEGAEERARGRALFRVACEGCHFTGGLAKPAPELSRPAEELLRLVRGGKGAMPAFPRDRISDQDLYSISTYLLWIKKQ